LKESWNVFAEIMTKGCLRLARLMDFYLFFAGQLRIRTFLVEDKISPNVIANEKHEYR
jgi:hypothetical protein